MLFTSHATAGAALGVASGNPVLGFFVGIISHHILDAVPHFDQGTFYTVKEGPPYLGREREPHDVHAFNGNRRDWIMLYVDWMISIVLFAVIFYSVPQSEWSLMFWGAAGGVMPDVLDSSPLWSRKLRAKARVLLSYHSFHLYFHWTVQRSRIWLGTITQVIIIGASVAYLLTL